jgi:hypothetical protein
MPRKVAENVYALADDILWGGPVKWFAKNSHFNNETYHKTQDKCPDE